MDSILKILDDSNHKVVVFYLNYSKAFDKVKILLKKFRKYDITGKLYDWIKDSLVNSLTNSSCGRIKSSFQNVDNSCPSGDSVGPFYLHYLCH